MKSEEQLAGDRVADPLQEAVTVVAAQISLALQEAQPSVELLGASVGRMIVTLGSIGRETAGRDALPGAAITELRRDAARATVELQFYDRMTQNLSHLQDYLASVGTLLGKTSAAQLDGAGQQGPGPPEWQALRERLLQRLVPDSHQPCRHAGSADIGRPQQASMGAVELF
jgi:hypothetical protein